MASAGSIGYQTLLQYDNAGYVTVAEVRDISGPNITVESVDFTSNDSTNGYMEFKAGLADGGEVSFNCIYTEAAYNTLVGFIRTSKTWRIQFSAAAGAGKWDFTGFITNISAAYPVKAEMTYDVTIKVDAKPTFATS